MASTLALALLGAFVMTMFDTCNGMFLKTKYLLLWLPEVLKRKRCKIFATFSTLSLVYKLEEF